MSIEFMASNTVTPACMKLFCFLLRAHYSFLALRNSRQRVSILPGDHFKQQNQPQKAQKCEKLALDRPQKGCLFTVSEPNQEGKESSTQILPLCSCLGITMKMLWVLIWGYKKFFY